MIVVSLVLALSTASLPAAPDTSRCLDRTDSSVVWSARCAEQASVYIEDSGRATRNMDRFAIVRDGANIRVDVNKLYEADKDGVEWAAAMVKIA